MKSNLFSVSGRQCGLLIILLAVLIITPQQDEGAAQPLGKSLTQNLETAKPGTKESVLLAINRMQLKARNELTGLIREFKTEGTLAVILSLALVSLLYGTLHALGPGHGKSIVMACMLSEENPSVAKGVFIGSVIALGETISAAVVVYGVYFFSLGRIKPLFDNVNATIQLISYGFLLFIGLGLLLFRVRKHLVWFRVKKTQDFPATQAQPQKSSFLAAVPLAIIPCPGVMILLVFMITMKLPLMGMLLALVMAVGMALTISCFGILIVVSKTNVLRFFTKNGSRLGQVEAFLEIGGALLIIFLASLMLLT